MSDRVGIFGGGQLAAYLCQAARNLRLETSVLAFESNSMAVHFADRSLVAPPTDLDALRALIAASDVLTFDLEDVPAIALQHIDRHASSGAIRVAPSIAVLQLLQNKLSQKQWLLRNGFPTAKFRLCSECTTIDELQAALGLPFVQKTHRGGYDGKGVQVIRGPGDAGSLWGADAYAEQFVQAQQELSVLVARSVTGEISTYPVVSMRCDEEGHLLRYAHAPADIGQPTAQAARTLAEQVVTRLQGTGVFAIEMFLTAQGRLLINEISPRVHNTGHLTIEGHVTSQYEQHLRAITGMPLGSTAQRSAVAMCNVLLRDVRGHLPDLACGVNAWNRTTNVHWYGKRDGSPLRKIGHITSTADDLRSAQQQVTATLAALAGHRAQAV